MRGVGLGLGTHVNPWLIHVNVWQKPLQYCKVISLQLIKINEKKKEIERVAVSHEKREEKVGESPSQPPHPRQKPLWAALV